jgi:integrase
MGAVTGSVRQRTPGSWELRVHTGRDPLTGRKRYAHRTVKGTRREAQAALARLVTEVGDGAHAPGREGTVAELLERWFDHGEADWSPTVVRSYRSIIDRVIVPRFGMTPLRKLRAADIDAFYAELRRRGSANGTRLSAASVRRIHSVLRRALAQGVKWGLLSVNPAANASPPREPHREASVPTAQQVGRLIEAAQAVNPDLSCFLRLAAVTGARRGELCGLTWRDIDFRKRRLLIERSVVVGPDGALFEKETKTHASRRISLDAGTVELLRFHRVRCKQAAAAAEAILSDDTYVFSHDVANRTPWRPDYVTLAFSRVRDELELDVRLHDLRHFAATSMLVNGQDVRTVSGRLGHADAATTLGVYAHFLESADEDAAELMGDIVGPTRRAKPDGSSTTL